MYLKEQKKSHESLKRINPNYKCGMNRNVAQKKEAKTALTLEAVRVHYGLNEQAVQEKVIQREALGYIRGNYGYLESGKKRPMMHEHGYAVEQKLGEMLETGIVQRYKGPITKKMEKKEVQVLIDQSETTKFDMRGHASKKHGQSIDDDDKMGRLIPFSSGFTTNVLLREAVTEALINHIGRINAWLGEKTEKNLVLILDMEERLKDLRKDSMGSGFRRSSLGNTVDKMVPPQKIENLTKVTVIFRKSEIGEGGTKQRARDTEWHLLTAYPCE